MTRQLPERPNLPQSKMEQRQALPLAAGKVCKGSGPDTCYSGR
jgi:hypothetical protein